MITIPGVTRSFTLLLSEIEIDVSNKSLIVYYLKLFYARYSIVFILSSTPVSIFNRNILYIYLQFRKVLEKYWLINWLQTKPYHPYCVILEKKWWLLLETDRYLRNQSIKWIFYEVKIYIYILVFNNKHEKYK